MINGTNVVMLVARWHDDGELGARRDYAPDLKRRHADRRRETRASGSRLQHGSTKPNPVARRQLSVLERARRQLSVLERSAAPGSLLVFCHHGWTRKQPFKPVRRRKLRYLWRKCNSPSSGAPRRRLG